MPEKKSNIAVIGAGIFGLTIAIKLAENGYKVTVLEKGKDILTCASGINQYRVHRGYHYPRSTSTAKECKDNFVSFSATFKDALISDTQQYYCISKENSLTSAEAFIDFCNKIDLEYSIIPDLDIVKSNSVDLTVKVNEDIFDLQIMYKTLWERLKSLSVNIKFGFEANISLLKKYDFTVVTTYCNNNDFVASLNDKVEYQYELCEKPVVKLPEKFRNRGVVILDGPFMCLDPYGRTGLHVMGHVVHAIHHTSIGYSPETIDLPAARLLNKGVIRDPVVTNFKRMISSASNFFADIEDCKHIGSMFTHRVVLPHVDDTDERPTIVRQITENSITVFSGKIPTCTRTAEKVLELIDSN